MIRAIREYDITGLETTLGFCLFVMQHEAFRSGNFDTRFVENYFTPAKLQQSPVLEEEQLAAALAVMLQQQEKVAAPAAILSDGQQSKWKKNRLAN